MKNFILAVILSFGSLAVAQDAPPQGQPPAPVIAPVAPDQQQQDPIQQPSSAYQGQWVNTSQYGWVYMPYGDQYVQGAGVEPYSYVYYDGGWCWLVSPWVWGYGPSPFWGVYGYGHFGWYGRGYGHWQGYHAAWGGRVGHYGRGGYVDHGRGGSEYHGGRGGGSAPHAPSGGGSHGGGGGGGHGGGGHGGGGHGGGGHHR